MLVNLLISGNHSNHDGWGLIWISNHTRHRLFNGWNIISIFNNLLHVYTSRPNEESHSIIPVRIIFSIEVWSTVDGVSSSNVINLLCHFSGSLTSTTVRKLNLRGRALMPIEGGSSMRRGVGSCFLKTFFVPETLNKLSQVLIWKHFELETEVNLFTITLLGSEQNKRTK